jgi:hypothetical protein
MAATKLAAADLDRQIRRSARTLQRTCVRQEPDQKGCPSHQAEGSLAACSESPNRRMDLPPSKKMGLVEIR